MKRIWITGMVGAVLLLGACNEAERDANVTVVKAGEQPAMSAEQHERPSSIELAGGEKVQLIGVPKLDTNPAQFEGRIAIAGRVEEVYAERSAFSLVDLAKMPGCDVGCCSPTQIPMSVPEGKFDGELPVPGDELVVIGNLTPKDTGFSFDVLEVRRGDATLLRQKPDTAAEKTA